MASTNQQLVAEKAAREAAEKRARDAMDKLAVAASLAVKEETRGTVITLPGNVLFQSGQAALLPAAQDKLNQVADALKHQEDHKMVVEGHTDSQGTESSNIDLSQRRAQTVRDYLVSRGVPDDKVTARAWGKAGPSPTTSPSRGARKTAASRSSSSPSRNADSPATVGLRDHRRLWRAADRCCRCQARRDRLARRPCARRGHDVWSVIRSESA